MHRLQLYNYPPVSFLAGNVSQSRRQFQAFAAPLRLIDDVGGENSKRFDTINRLGDAASDVVCSRRRPLGQAEDNRVRGPPLSEPVAAGTRTATKRSICSNGTGCHHGAMNASSCPSSDTFSRTSRCGKGLPVGLSASIQGRRRRGRAGSWVILERFISFLGLMEG